MAGRRLVSNNAWTSGSVSVRVAYGRRTAGLRSGRHASYRLARPAITTPTRRAGVTQLAECLLPKLTVCSRAGHPNSFAMAFALAPYRAVLRVLRAR